MNVTIVKADPSRLAECREVFLDSALYDHYFTAEGRLEGMLATAVEKGHVLLRTFEGVSRAMGYRKASLMVSHFNPRAKALYQSMGYQKVGYVPDAIVPGVHENIMVKDL